MAMTPAGAAMTQKAHAQVLAKEQARQAMQQQAIQQQQAQQAIQQQQAQQAAQQAAAQQAAATPQAAPQVAGFPNDRAVMEQRLAAHRARLQGSAMGGAPQAAPGGIPQAPQNPFRQGRGLSALADPEVLSAITSGMALMFPEGSADRRNLQSAAQIGASIGQRKRQAYQDKLAHTQAAQNQQRIQQGERGLDQNLLGMNLEHTRWKAGAPARAEALEGQKISNQLGTVNLEAAQAEQDAREFERDVGEQMRNLRRQKAKEVAAQRINQNPGIPVTDAGAKGRAMAGDQAFQPQPQTQAQPQGGQRQLPDPTQAGVQNALTGNPFLAPPQKPQLYQIQPGDDNATVAAKIQLNQPLVEEYQNQLQAYNEAMRDYFTTPVSQNEALPQPDGSWTVPPNWETLTATVNGNTVPVGAYDPTTNTFRPMDTGDVPLTDMLNAAPELTPEQKLAFSEAFAPIPILKEYYGWDKIGDVEGLTIMEGPNGVQVTVVTPAQAANAFRKSAKARLGLMAEDAGLSEEAVTEYSKYIDRVANNIEKGAGSINPKAEGYKEVQRVSDIVKNQFMSDTPAGRAMGAPPATGGDLPVYNYENGKVISTKNVPPEDVLYDEFEQQIPRTVIDPLVKRLGAEEGKKALNVVYRALGTRLGPRQQMTMRLPGGSKAIFSTDSAGNLATVQMEDK